jgi:hypothetical protein
MTLPWIYGEKSMRGTIESSSNPENGSITQKKDIYPGAFISSKIGSIGDWRGGIMV